MDTPPANPLDSHMDTETRALVEAIHATPTQAVLVVTGAGSRALAWLLGVGGASRTVIEASVPYAATAMRAYIGYEPSKYTSTATAAALARAAHARAIALLEAAPGDRASSVLGVACTATIATDRTKRGEHRAFVAIEDGSGASRVTGVTLEKGARDRDSEEALVSRLVLNALAEASGVAHRLEVSLRPEERLVTASVPPEVAAS